jgi:membrane protease YdiL (CAAX protease family)
MEAATVKKFVLLELLVVGALAAWFVGTFTERPSYVDMSAAFLAVGLIALGGRRSAGLWLLHQPALTENRKRRLAEASRAVMGFTIPVVLLFLLGGLALGYSEGGAAGAAARVANWHLLAAVCLYFPWALLQQFIFQFYLLGRLLTLLPAWAALTATALAFSAVHFPRAPVMAATAVAGFVWALNYRKHRSLLPLAVSHALLGATMHYWIFGNDLFDRWLLGGRIG